MVTSEKMIMIHRPVDEVFASVCDLQNSPQWQKGLVEARQITEGPVEIGTQYANVRKFTPGRNLESVFQCTTYELNKKIAFKTLSSLWPYEDIYLFESVDGGTRLVNRLELQISGWMTLAGPLIAFGLRSDMAANIRNLKDMLESRVKPPRHDR
jgi:hypothetical protein